MRILTLIILFLALCAGNLFSFTENFLDVTYKDTALSTAGWARSGMVVLPVKGIIKVKEMTRTHYCIDLDVDTAGGYVYIGGSTQGSQLNIDSAIVVYDVNNPYSPVLVGETTPTINNDWRGGQGFRFYKDRTVFISTYYCVQGIQQYDFTNFAQPVMKYSFGPGDVWDLFIHKDRLYTSPRPDYGGWKFGIYDINTASAPVIYRAPGDTTRYGTYTHAPVCANDTYVFYSANDGAETFLVYKLEDTSLVKVTYGIHGYSRIQGNYIYKSGLTDQFRVVDVSDVNNPTVAGQKVFSGSGTTGRPYCWANYTFIPAVNGIWAIDNSDVLTMKTAVSYLDSAKNYRAVGVINNRLFAGRNTGPFTVFDIQFDSTAVAVSKTVLNPALNIYSAVLDAVDTSVAGINSITYYISVDEGTTWEGPVQKGTPFIFTKLGNKLKWKAVMSTSIDTISPIIYGVTVQEYFDTSVPAWSGNVGLKTQVASDYTKFNALLTWDPATDSNSISYEVEKNENGETWALDSTVTDTYIRIYNLSNVSKWKFKVRAKDIWGNTTDFCAELYDIDTPSWEGKITVTDASVKDKDGIWKYAVTLSWKDATDNTSEMMWYEIQWDDTAGQLTKSDRIAGVNRFYIAGLTADFVQDFKVRAIDVCGNATEWKTASIGLSQNGYAKIGKSGGSVVLEDYDGNASNNTQVDFPEGVFLQDMNVTIKKMQELEYEIVLEDANGRKTDDMNLRKPVTLTLAYDADYVKAMGYNEDKLVIFYYDSVKWIPIGGRVDKNNRVVTTKLNHMSLFRIMESSDVSALIAVPQTFTPNSDGINDAVRFNFTKSGMVSSNTVIYIYDSTGKIVRGINTEGGTSIGWDGKDENGAVCESGAYVYRVTDAVGKSHSGVIILTK